MKFFYDVYGVGPGSLTPLGRFTSYKEASRFVAHVLKERDCVRIQKVAT